MYRESIGQVMHTGKMSGVNDELQRQIDARNDIINAVHTKLKSVFGYKLKIFEEQTVRLIASGKKDEDQLRTWAKLLVDNDIDLDDLKIYLRWGLRALVDKIPNVDWKINEFLSNISPYVRELKTPAKPKTRNWGAIGSSMQGRKGGTSGLSPKAQEILNKPAPAPAPKVKGLSPAALKVIAKGMGEAGGRIKEKLQRNTREQLLERYKREVAPNKKVSKPAAANPKKPKPQYHSCKSCCEPCETAHTAHTCGSASKTEKPIQAPFRGGSGGALAAIAAADTERRLKEKEHLTAIEKQALAFYEKNVPECAAEHFEIKKIHVDHARFQNRQNAFSEASAQSVAENYNPNVFDPIVIWLDTANGKHYVLSGHSRLEGMKRRGETTIPARFFIGTENEAMRFGKVEANRAATPETIQEDINAYVLMRDGAKGIEKLSEKALHEKFKGRWQKLDAFSYLDKEGSFIRGLSIKNTSDFPYIETYSQWVGELRKFYNEKHATPIGNIGEQDIFNYLYYSDQKRRIEKDTLSQLVATRLFQYMGTPRLFPECQTGRCDTMKSIETANDDVLSQVAQLNKEEAQLRKVLTQVRTKEEKSRITRELLDIIATKEKLTAGRAVRNRTQTSFF